MHTPAPPIVGRIPNPRVQVVATLRVTTACHAFCKVQYFHFHSTDLSLKSYSFNIRIHVMSFILMAHMDPRVGGLWYIVIVH